jgi:hypothetical protein
LEGYYSNEGECYQCTVFDGNTAMLVVSYLLVIAAFVLGLSTIIWFSIQSVFSDFAISPPLSMLSTVSGKTDLEHSSPSLPRVSRPRFTATIFDVSRLTLFLGRVDQSARRKVFRGTSMSFKLLLSFVQVVSGSFYVINMGWSYNSQELFRFLHLNPLQALDATYQCSSSLSGYSSDFRYFVVLLFQFCTPIFFLLLLLGISYTVYLFSLSRLRSTSADSLRESNASESDRSRLDSCGSISDRKSNAVERDKTLRQEIWNTAAKIYLWFCLIAYPTLSSGYVFSCSHHLSSVSLSQPLQDVVCVQLSRSWCDRNLHSARLLCEL